MLTGDKRKRERTYDHFNDGFNGSHLGGPGVVCGREVLSVMLVCGDERQPSVLRKQSDKPITIFQIGLISKNFVIF